MDQKHVRIQRLGLARAFFVLGSMIIQSLCWLFLLLEARKVTNSLSPSGGYFKEAGDGFLKSSVLILMTLLMISLFRGFFLTLTSLREKLLTPLLLVLKGGEPREDMLFSCHANMPIRILRT